MTDANLMPKRAIMLVPGKGGTGKSLFTRLLYYAIRQAGINAIGFDSDAENPEFGNYHQQKKYEVFCVDVLKKAGSIKLLDMLDKKRPDVAVIDMPAASSKRTRERLETLNLLDLSQDKSMPYRFTLVCVLDVGLPAVRSFQQAMTFYGDRADYVAVRNQFWLDPEDEEAGFDIWEKSEAYPLFESLHGIEIEMPVLDSLTGRQMHPETNFFEINSLSSVGHRLIAQSFLRRGVAELAYAAPYLGLPPTSVQAEATSKATEAA